MNLPLPPALHAAIFKEARRSGVPATKLVRQILGDWLQAHQRAREEEEIREFARRHAGSEIDLDEDLEGAATETLMGAEKRNVGR
jgi:hypothetical protein